MRWFKAPDRSSFPTRPDRPATAHCFSVFPFITVLLSCKSFLKICHTFDPLPGRCGCDQCLNFKTLSRGFWAEKITLSGGSLGSCVDEERSQLRELM